MILARHILEKKGFDIWSISPNSKIFDALKLMAKKMSERLW